MPKTEKYVCCRCGNPFEDLSSFYKSNSKLYSHTGYLPICKNCFEEQFQVYKEKYKDSMKAMQRMCMAFDLYFSDSVFESCKNDDATLVGNYVKRLNMVQYKNRTFDYSLDSGFEIGQLSEKSMMKSDDIEDTRPTPKVKKVDIEKWGYGFEPEDYEVLSEHYKYLKNANPNCDSNQEIFIDDLCMIKMMQTKAARERRVDDYKKLSDQYIRSFQQAGLKTVKDTSANEDFTIGVNAETIEKYTPAEYYKNQKLYKDYDDIGDYFKRFILRPLRNLQYGTEDRDYEYYVKDESDADDDQDE